jgi:hypothetical protein
MLPLLPIALESDHRWCLVIGDPVGPKSPVSSPFSPFFSLFRILQKKERDKERKNEIFPKNNKSDHHNTKIYNKNISFYYCYNVGVFIFIVFVFRRSWGQCSEDPSSARREEAQTLRCRAPVP